MRRLWLALVLLMVAAPGAADLASLVADRVEIGDDGTITAEGNVTVIFEGVRMTAERVIYDQDTERLELQGPLTIIDGEDTQILASAAEIDPALRDGLMRSARLVLDQQLQLAANQLDRIDGRYTRLTRVIASSCEVCDENQTPTWEIRAREVIHDTDEKQLYFTDAQLRILGVPVFYTPRLRLPDPTLDRADGFLVPRLQSRSRLGTGIKTPYFLTFGDHADLRLTPYLSPETTTLEARYRQEFSTGSLVVEGAASQDTIEDDGGRAYIFADATFALPRNYELRFDLRVTSDDEYLRDYGYFNGDRLESGLSISRTQDRETFQAAGSAIRTLRFTEEDFDAELPDRLAELSWTKRVLADPRWGQAWLTFDALAVQRPSSEQIFGRDTSRFTVAADWQKSWTLPVGVVATAEAGLALDAVFVGQDPTFEDSTTRSVPSASFELRWPLHRTETGGALHLVEPIVQLAWAETYGGEVPNEDSTAVEFDEGNLFSLSRFPGRDAYEEGLRLNVGLSWTRSDPDGWSIGSTVGRVVRFSGSSNQFGADTGLDGDLSDWLLSFQVNASDQLSVTNRSIINDGLDVSRSETRLALATDRSDLAATYIWLAAEPFENRFEDSSELALDAGYMFNRFWTGAFDVRYETDVDRATSAGVGLKYENECFAVDLNFSRRFTSSDEVEPITELGVQVSLSGFGTRGRSERVRRCAR
ncbi:MAG: LPS assembly protein LptD [Pseudomonadota bacterium]